VSADNLGEGVVVTGTVPPQKLLVGGGVRTGPVDRVPPCSELQFPDSRAVSGSAAAVSLGS
jgi:hypothetical protein